MSERRFDNVPGGAELWRVGGSNYLVYHIPQVGPFINTSIPLAFEIMDDDQLQAIVGPLSDIEYDRELSVSQAREAGWLNFGVSEQLLNTAEHPFRVLVANFEREATTRPWMFDPEVFALICARLLQGQVVSQEDLATTSWWRDRTAAQREWMVLRETDPRESERVKADNRLRVQQMLQQAGAVNPPQTVVNALADFLTNGTFSESMVSTQVQALADPHSQFDVHPSLLNRIPGFSSWVSGDQPGDHRFNSPDDIRRRVAAIRHNRGLAPDHASDMIWVNRILAGTHTLGDARTAITNKAWEQVMSGESWLGGIVPVGDRDPDGYVDDWGGYHAPGSPVGEGADPYPDDGSGPPRPPVDPNDPARPPDDYATTIQYKEEVRQLVREWLGPLHPWSDQRLEEWAGRIRNDVSGRERLVAELSRMRLALYPAYDDPTLTYDMIAAPWESMFLNTWGSSPWSDQTASDLFERIIQFNDAQAARQMLIRTGLDTNNKKVVADFLSSMTNVMEDTVSPDAIRR